MQARHPRLVSDSYVFSKHFNKSFQKPPRSFYKKLDHLTRLYLSSRATRSLASLVWCSATMGAALLEIVRDAQGATCHNIRLTFVGSASYMVISTVCLVTQLLGHRMPTISLVMFSFVGGIMHLFAGADALQWKTDIRAAAVLSIISGLMLTLDACVTCVNDAILSFYSDTTRTWSRDKMKFRRKLKDISSTEISSLTRKNSQEPIVKD